MGEPPGVDDTATEGWDREAELGVLRVLERLIEYRRQDVGRSVGQVADLAARMAQELEVEPGTVERLRLAAPLHDIGMVIVPDRILLKKDALDEQEREIMSTHTVNGARILSESDLPVFQMAREIALCHHERWDGDGYPRGLAGEEIPLPARIVAVADAYEAITHDQPFREAGTSREALEEIISERGKQFDPDVVDALVEVISV